MIWKPSQRCSIQSSGTPCDIDTQEHSHFCVVIISPVKLCKAAVTAWTETSACSSQLGNILNAQGPQCCDFLNLDLQVKVDSDLWGTVLGVQGMGTFWSWVEEEKRSRRWDCRAAQLSVAGAGSLCIITPCRPWQILRGLWLLLLSEMKTHQRHLNREWYDLT